MAACKGFIINSECCDFSAAQHFHTVPWACIEDFLVTQVWMEVTWSFSCPPALNMEAWFHCHIFAVLLNMNCSKEVSTKVEWLRENNNLTEKVRIGKIWGIFMGSQWSPIRLSAVGWYRGRTRVQQEKTGILQRCPKFWFILSWTVGPGF